MTFFAEKVRILQHIKTPDKRRKIKFVLVIIHQTPSYVTKPTFIMQSHVSVGENYYDCYISGFKVLTPHIIILNKKIRGRTTYLSTNIS